MSNILWSTFQYNSSGSPLENLLIKGLAATKDGGIIAITSSGTETNYLAYKLEIDSKANILSPNTWRKLQTRNYEGSGIPNESQNITPGFASISNLYDAQYQVIDERFPDTRLIPSVFASLSGSNFRSFQTLGLSGENTWIGNAINRNSMSSTRQYNLGDYKQIKKGVMVSIPSSNPGGQIAYIKPYAAFIYKLNDRGLDKITFIGLTGYSISDPVTYQTNYWRGMQGAIVGAGQGITPGNYRKELESWGNSVEINGVMSNFSNSIDDIASNYPFYYNYPTNTQSENGVLLATSCTSNVIRKIPMNLNYNNPSAYTTSSINGITGIKNIAFAKGYFIATPFATTNKVYYTYFPYTGWQSSTISGSGIGNINFRTSHIVSNSPKVIIVCGNRIFETENILTGWSVSNNSLANLTQNQNLIVASTSGRASIYAGINEDGTILVGKEKLKQFDNITLPPDIYPDSKIFLPSNTNVNLPINYSTSNPNIFRLDSSDNSLVALAPGTAALFINQSGDDTYEALNRQIDLVVSNFTTGFSTFSWNQYQINLSGVSGPYQLGSSTNTNPPNIILHSVGNSSITYVTSDITKTGMALSSAGLQSGWVSFSGLRGLNTGARISANNTYVLYQQPDAGETIVDPNASGSIARPFFSTSASSSWDYHGGGGNYIAKKYIPNLSVSIADQPGAPDAVWYSLDTFIINNSNLLVGFYNKRNCTLGSTSLNYDCMDTFIISGRLSGNNITDAATNNGTARGWWYNLVSSTGSNRIGVDSNTYDGVSKIYGKVEPIVDTGISGISSIAYDDGYDLFIATSNQTGQHIYYSLTGSSWGKVNIGTGINFKDSKIIAGQGKYSIFAKSIDNIPVTLTSSGPGGPWNILYNSIIPYDNQNPIYLNRTSANRKSILAITTNNNNIAYAEINNATKLNPVTLNFWNSIPSSPLVGSVYSFPSLRTNDSNQTGILSTSDSSIISVDNIFRRITINKKGSATVSIRTSGTSTFDPLIVERTFFPKLSQTVTYTVPTNVTVGASYPIFLGSSVGLPVSYACSDSSFISIDLTRKVLTVLQPGKTATITVSQGGNESYDSYVATYTVSAPKADQTLSLSNLPNLLQAGQQYDLPSTSSENISIIYSSLNTGIGNITSGNKLIINRCGEFLINAVNTGNSFYNSLNQNYLLKTNTGCLHLSTAYIPPIVQINSIYPLPSTTNANRIINYTLSNSGIGRFLYNSFPPFAVTGLQITGYSNSVVSLTASGDSYYNTYSASYNFNSYKTFQSYSWLIPSGISVGVVYNLQTGTNVGLPLSYTSSNPQSIAIVNGNKLVATGVGSATIFVTAPGSSLYEPINWYDTNRYVEAFKITQTGSGFKNIPRITKVGVSYQLEEFTSAGIPIKYSSSNSGIARIRIV